MKKLNPADFGFLLFESRQTPMHVAGLHIYSIPDDASPNFLQELIHDFRHVDEYQAPFNQVLKYPALKAGTPGWVQDNEFDLDYHLRHSALPAPGGMKELEILVSRLHGTLLDRSRPMWEMHFIEGIEGGKKYAVYFKMHHALIDGVGGMRLMESCLSSKQDKKLPPPWGARSRKPKKSKPTPQLSELLATVFDNALTQARTVPQITRAYARLAREAVKQETSLGVPYKAPRSILNQPITGQRRFTVKSFDLDRIKTLGKSLGATLNDVVMAMCGSAMRIYLLEHDALPSKPLVADVPVSIRPADGGSSGNAISFILANMGTELDDPAERLKAIQESMTEGKNLLQGMSREAIMNYTMTAMAPFTAGQAAGISFKRRPMFNVVISNVPGPKSHLYMNGARLEEVYPVSLLFHGQALNFTITSYVDTLDFGLIGCRDALPGIAKVADHLDAALEELESIAG